MSQLRILRFTTDYCTFCKAQKKALIVERFKDGQQGMALVELVCAATDEELKDPNKKRAYELAEEDVYDVKSFPTLIVEARLPDGSAIELFRAEGPITLKQLEKMAEETIIVRKNGPGWTT